MKARDFLNQLEHDDIVTAIRRAEQMTSGEIRVLISHKKPADPMAAAQKAFLRMGMTQTVEHNGVLVFVAPRSRNFAIIGDKEVHAKCGVAFWRQVTEEMTAQFHNGKFSEAILHGIRKVGDLLAQHFPPRSGNRNELTDEVAHD